MTIATAAIGAGYRATSCASKPNNAKQRHMCEQGGPPGHALSPFKAVFDSPLKGRQPARDPTPHGALERRASADRSPAGALFAPLSPLGRRPGDAPSPYRWSARTRPHLPVLRAQFSQPATTDGKSTDAEPARPQSEGGSRGGAGDGKEVGQAHSVRVLLVVQRCPRPLPAPQAAETPPFRKGALSLGTEASDRGRFFCRRRVQVQFSEIRSSAYTVSFFYERNRSTLARGWFLRAVAVQRVTLFSVQC
jgi:hypothetical protein